MALHLLSDEEARTLSTLIAREKQRIQNTQNRSEVLDNLPQPPDVFVVKAPVGGIPALDAEPGTGTGTGTMGYPGSAVATIYRLGLLLGYPKLIEKEKTQKVYNLSESEIPEGSWALAIRDKHGTWWAIPTAVSEPSASGNTTIELVTVNDSNWETVTSGGNTRYYMNATIASSALANGTPIKLLVGSTNLPYQPSAHGFYRNQKLLARGPLSSGPSYLGCATYSPQEMTPDYDQVTLNSVIASNSTVTTWNATLITNSRVGEYAGNYIVLTLAGNQALSYEAGQNIWVRRPINDPVGGPNGLDVPVTPNAATLTFPGLVNTGTQSFNGPKFFEDTISLGNNATSPYGFIVTSVGGGGGVVVIQSGNGTSLTIGNNGAFSSEEIAITGPNGNSTIAVQANAITYRGATTDTGTYRMIIDGGGPNGTLSITQEYLVSGLLTTAGGSIIDSLNTNLILVPSTGENLTAFLARNGLS